MKNVFTHPWKLFGRQSGILLHCQKTWKCELHYLNTRHACQSGTQLQPSVFHHPRNHSNELTKIVVNYSTSRKKFKPTKPRSPEEIDSLPVFQYASDTSKNATRIYMWGSAIYGALGIREYLIPLYKHNPRSKQQRPARLPFIDDHDVTHIACGYGFTVLSARAKGSSKEYGVFGTGLNSDSQIGYHASHKPGSALGILVSPSRIDMPFQSPNVTRVKRIACGRAHTLILTDEEGVFSLGNNAYGQCGRAIVENEDYKNNPRVNKVRLDEEIEEIVCGQDNSLFLTKKGEVYTCGWGADGQLGTGTYRNEWKPAKVGGDIAGEKIKQISCAADCVLAVSENGDLFGWGNNEYNQISNSGDVPQLSIPRHMSTNHCGKIAQAAAAGTMCAVLNTEGQVYVWGYGLLGMGPEVQHKHTFTPLPMTLFGRNEFNPTASVTKVRSSLSHFAAITNEGNLYMWGRNKQGCLGLGMDDDQFFPLRVAVPAKVTEISCGVDHTAVICKTFM